MTTLSIEDAFDADGCNAVHLDDAHVGRVRQRPDERWSKFLFEPIGSKRAFTFASLGEMAQNLPAILRATKPRP